MKIGQKLIYARFARRSSPSIVIITIISYGPQWGIGPQWYPSPTKNYALLMPNWSHLVQSQLSSSKWFRDSPLPLPSCVHLRTTLGILSVPQLHRRNKSYDKVVFFNFKFDTCASSLLVQVIVGNFAGLEDIADLLQTAIVKGSDFVYSLLKILQHSEPFSNSDIQMCLSLLKAHLALLGLALVSYPSGQCYPYLSLTWDNTCTFWAVGLCWCWLILLQ